MKPVDRFVERATAGLPRRERLETAVELRSHLDARVAAFVRGGLTHREAEHMAIAMMGDPRQASRGFLGHAFTPRLGWWTLGALVVLVAAWISTDLVRRPLELRAVGFDDALLASFIDDARRFETGIPRDFSGVVLAASYGAGEHAASVMAGGMSPATDRAYHDTRWLLRPRFEVVAGRLAAPAPGCADDAVSLVVLSAPRNGLAQREVLCLLRPERDFVGAFVPLIETRITPDAWLPFALYRPEIWIEELGTHVMAPPAYWVLLSLWVGRETVSPGTAPPTIASLRDTHPEVIRDHERRSPEREQALLGTLPERGNAVGSTPEASRQAVCEPASPALREPLLGPSLAPPLDLLRDDPGSRGGDRSATPTP